MSGGAEEYVAAYINDRKSNTLEQKASKLANGQKKYKNEYKFTANTSFTTNKNIYGDAIYETSTGDGGNAWYNEGCNYPYQEDLFESYPIFTRGGRPEGGNNPGIFSYNCAMGDGYEIENNKYEYYYSFRTTIVVLQ